MKPSERILQLADERRDTQPEGSQRNRCLLTWDAVIATLDYLDEEHKRRAKWEAEQESTLKDLLKRVEGS